ncbi:hypothetical protein GQ55_5G142100 [Panicum hallii var. hallii]|uniref:Uncharacterized protein n=1 Tax=Panicum hallii var. hallii TaxID=1504633 RepID=A0A2T7DG57_9POAL|nr:hypothetical protein GQ55_5G142100 [Panicum hallii var. hallii]PUZ54564.1 hypothetical protein GQ55_5G142100 [Panicum hallii var. hallii]
MYISTYICSCKKKMCPCSCRVLRLHHIADIGLARRCQWWLLASLFHSVTSIMITVKESDSLHIDYRSPSQLAKLLGPSITLILSIILLLSLVKHYPITQDVLITRFIVGYICIGYLSILLTDFIYFKVTTVMLELILIPVTICMHALRFTTQGPLVEFEMKTLILALLAAIPAVLCLIPLDETFWEHLLKQLALKIATLVAAVFRGLDVIAMLCHATREAANYLRSRLHECF